MLRPHLLANNVLRDIKQLVECEGLALTAPITTRIFRKRHRQNHAENVTPMHVLHKLIGRASITTTRRFYLRVGDASEREVTGRYGRLWPGPDSGSDSGDEPDARMTPEGDGK